MANSMHHRRQTTVSRLRTLLLLLFIGVLVGSSGCSVYFNTFYNAKKAFNSAEKQRENTGRSNKAEYQKAIEKALKVVENHPNSKYYDDAVYILAVSYFHTELYSRAERRFREILANYGDSEWARESNLYLAQAKLALGDIEEAQVIFEDIFESDYEKNFKAEAAIALGEYNFEEGEWDRARRYFLAVRDSLGDDEQKLKAQIYVADSYFEGFLFSDALGAYLQILGMKPDKNQKYHSLFRSAVSSYRLLRIEDGLDYLDQLIDDALYFDSLGALRLTVAEGLEYDDDLIGAEAAYLDVARNSDNRQWQSRAYYRLGLIYQFDYDDLRQAKDYYDQATAADRSREAGRDALVRSSDIGKLDTYARTELDSAATETAIDEAAYTQYQLSELYWFKLNKPDSAIVEMQYIVDSMPLAYHVPKALIALSQMYRVQYEDDHAADSILKLVLTDHAQSDYVPEALDALGLKGTAADTGYAELYVHRAEDFVEAGEIDSAIANYQVVVDRYPDSKYHLTAQFSTIWLTEMYQSPGDSSVIVAYQEFADSFGGTEWGQEARRRIQPPRSTRRDDRERDEERPPRDDGLDEEVDRPPDVDDNINWDDPLVAVYYRPNGDTLVELKLDPLETLEEFEFPAEANTGDRYDWKLYFQIRIDFSGEVKDLVLKIPSGVPQMDENAELTVRSMRFDALDASNRLVSAGKEADLGQEGKWFVFVYDISKPEYLR